MNAAIVFKILLLFRVCACGGIYQDPISLSYHKWMKKGQWFRTGKVIKNGTGGKGVNELLHLPFLHQIHSLSRLPWLEKERLKELRVLWVMEKMHVSVVISWMPNDCGVRIREVGLCSLVPPLCTCIQHSFWMCILYSYVVQSVPIPVLKSLISNPAFSQVLDGACQCIGSFWHDAKCGCMCAALPLMHQWHKSIISSSSIDSCLLVNLLFLGKGLFGGFSIFLNKRQSYQWHQPIENQWKTEEEQNSWRMAVSLLSKAPVEKTLP